ncbi:MAG: SEFIR domain-containing protein, partial [Desulfovibrionaceae bacterium]
MQPTVFISYSWSSPEHREQIREWADRLLSDGISVIIDAYDLH